MSEVLLVTGSSGIAAANARLWGGRDPVFIVGIKSEECRALAAELPAAGFHAADVRDAAAVQKSLAACVRAVGIDALFNVAGINARFLSGPVRD